ncbi:Nitrate reductase 1 [Daphnia magna]|uniref:Nitrate reductase 1 n=1 Tax=Daphnia magna TaxID=35525 RepID=A0A164UTK1_9CRUS|nr:Nitrate reductase 1 [Daphnia magna]
MKNTSITDIDLSSLKNALTTATLSQQMVSLASSTFRLAASAITRLQQQQRCEAELASLAHLPEYSLEQVSWHDQQDDCWIVLNDKVYNVTKLIHNHPGGLEVMMEQAGRDATLAFRSVGHSIDTIEQVDEFLVGILPVRERMYLRSAK